MRRNLPMAAWITVVWIALWGDLSWANLAGGAAVSALLLWVVRLPGAGGARRPSVPGSLRFAAEFAKDLTVATAQVARQVFWPVDRLRPAVLEVPLITRDAGLLTLVANSITLTPGTMTLEVDGDRGVLFVHLLHLAEGGEQDVVADARRLERLGARALRVPLEEAS